MDRITFLNSKNQALAGNLFPAPSRAAVVLAHGFTADKSSLGRFDRLAESFNSKGYNALAVDFSGCGESDGIVSGVDQQVDDLKSAISFVQSRGAENIGLYGHSLGSLICLKSFSSAIAAMVLSGALTDSMHYDWSEHYSERQLQELR